MAKKKWSKIDTKSLLNIKTSAMMNLSPNSNVVTLLLC